MLAYIIVRLMAIVFNNIHNNHTYIIIIYNTVQDPRNYPWSESQTLLQQCNIRRSIPYPTGTKEQMDAVLKAHENINKTPGN